MVFFYILLVIPKAHQVALKTFDLVHQEIVLGGNWRNVWVGNWRNKNETLAKAC